MGKHEIHIKPTWILGARHQKDKRIRLIRITWSETKNECISKFDEYVANGANYNIFYLINLANLEVDREGRGQID